MGDATENDGQEGSCGLLGVPALQDIASLPPLVPSALISGSAGQVMAFAAHFSALGRWWVCPCCLPQPATWAFPGAGVGQEEVPGCPTPRICPRDLQNPSASWWPGLVTLTCSSPAGPVARAAQPPRSHWLECFCFPADHSFLLDCSWGQEDSVSSRAGELGSGGRSLEQCHPSIHHGSRSCVIGPQKEQYQVSSWSRPDAMPSRNSF